MENAMARMMMMIKEADQRKRQAVRKRYALNETRKKKLQCPMVMMKCATKVLYRARTATPTAPNRAAL
jgi:hypothetical protein